MTSHELDKKMAKHHFRLFGKSERSSFAYWFYHWKAFNLTAFYLGVWRFSFLFHDIEKPWLKLLWRDYKKVQQWHRIHNSHHAEYKGGIAKINWLQLIIDNESCRFSKRGADLTCREYVNYVLGGNKASLELKEAYKANVVTKLDELGL